MKRMVVKLGGHVKVRLRRLRRSTRHSRLALRCQIVLQAGKGRSSRQIAENVDCHRSWVSRVVKRFLTHGEAGLIDGREDNGEQKVDEQYLAELYELVSHRPTDYGHRRPTWTRELLILVMEQRTGVRIHATTMTRALKTIGARRANPRPTVRCPWSKQAKSRRLNKIRRLVDNAAEHEVVLYADEVDIHLNPKIGLDWTNRGQRKEVVTPGKNEKRYVAGVMNAQSGSLTCVASTRKNSALVIELLQAVDREYGRAGRIHVVLDNYRIHSSKITQRALAAYDGRIVFHFLPPYCPNDNKIERVWLDLHSEVTRNHNCKTMEELMENVWHFLRRRGATVPRETGKIAA